MCDTDEPDKIYWMGWETSWQALRAFGWTITRKPSFKSWHDVKNTKAAHEYIYIRHPAMNMIGRITPSGQCNDAAGWELDFMTVEHNGRLKKKPVYMERDITEKDIAPMMELILTLQSQRPKRKRQSDDDKVLSFAKTA